MKKFTKFLVSGLLIVGGLYGISQHTNNETQVAEARIINSTDDSKEAWSVIGSFEGSNWATDIPMDYDQYDDRYEATLDLKAGDQFKIRLNKSWDKQIKPDGGKNTGNGIGDYLEDGGTTDNDNYKVKVDGTYIIWVVDDKVSEYGDMTYGFGITPSDQYFAEFDVNADEANYENEGITGIRFYSALIKTDDHTPEKNENGVYYGGFEFTFWHDVTTTTEIKKLYLTPNSNWKQANARFAAYFFGNGEKWMSMSDTNGDGIYEVNIPTDKTYPSVIFCRMNPSTTTNNWDNRWNQTEDLTIPTNTNNHFSVKSGTWDKGGGTWAHIDNPVDSVTESKELSTKRYTLLYTSNSIETKEGTTLTTEGDSRYLAFFEVILIDIPETCTKVDVKPAYAYNNGTDDTYQTQYGSTKTFALSNGLLA